MYDHGQKKINAGLEAVWGYGSRFDEKGEKAWAFPELVRPERCD